MLLCCFQVSCNKSLSVLISGSFGCSSLYYHSFLSLNIPLRRKSSFKTLAQELQNWSKVFWTRNSFSDKHWPYSRPLTGHLPASHFLHNSFAPLLGVAWNCFHRYCRADLRPGWEDADWSHPVERSGFCQPLAAHGGEREALVALGGAAATLAPLQGGLQLLLEVAVEEAVHHGVDAGGGHRRQVTGGKDGVVLAVGERLVVPVKQRVEDIQRQPAQGEGYDDG